MSYVVIHFRKSEKEEGSMKEKVLDFLHDEDGLTTVEYALAAALITAALVAAFTDLGSQVAALVTNIVDNLA